MNITETRRKNLSRWIAANGTPPKEKSLFSQLKGDGSFGEKVARRLERDYKMPPGFLDSAVSPEIDAPPSLKKSEETPISVAGLGAPRWMDSDAFMLLNLFDALDDRRRSIVIQYVRNLVNASQEIGGVNKG